MKHKKRCITMYIAWFVVYISLDAVHAKEQQVDSHQDSLLKQAIKYRWQHSLSAGVGRHVHLCWCWLPHKMRCTAVCVVPAMHMFALELLLSCCSLFDCRDKPDATVRELKIAVGLLKEAAGLVGTRTNAAKASKRVPVPGFPDLQFADNGLPAALRELAKCYQVPKTIRPALSHWRVDAFAKHL
jgi:hypothetical protein